MRVAIHQPNLLPWLGFFAKAMQADVLVLLDDVPLGRPSFTNRVRVMGPNGPCWLTVPVRHEKPAPLIRDARVPDGAHRRARDKLRAWYGSAVTRYLGTPRILSLYEGNRLWLDDLDAYIGKAAMVRASALRTTPLPKVAGNIQLCRELGADTYLAGNGADYDDPAVYEAAGIRYERAKFTHPVYEQRRPRGMDFVPGLSVLDALANVGAEETRRMIEEAGRC